MEPPRHRPAASLPQRIQDVAERLSTSAKAEIYEVLEGIAPGSDLSSLLRLEPLVNDIVAQLSDSFKQAVTKRLLPEACKLLGARPGALSSPSSWPPSQAPSNLCSSALSPSAQYNQQHENDILALGGLAPGTGQPLRPDQGPPQDAASAAASSLLLGTAASPFSSLSPSPGAATASAGGGSGGTFLHPQPHSLPQDHSRFSFANVSGASTAANSSTRRVAQISAASPLRGSYGGGAATTGDASAPTDQSLFLGLGTGGGDGNGIGGGGGLGSGLGLGLSLGAAAGDLGSSSNGTTPQSDAAFLLGSHLASVTGATGAIELAAAGGGGGGTPSSLSSPSPAHSQSAASGGDAGIVSRQLAHMSLGSGPMGLSQPQLTSLTSSPHPNAGVASYAHSLPSLSVRPGSSLDPGLATPPVSLAGTEPLRGGPHHTFQTLHGQTGNQSQQQQQHGQHSQQSLLGSGCGGGLVGELGGGGGGGGGSAGAAGTPVPLFGGAPGPSPGSGGSMQRQQLQQQQQYQQQQQLQYMQQQQFMSSPVANGNGYQQQPQQMQYSQQQQQQLSPCSPHMYPSPQQQHLHHQDNGSHANMTSSPSGPPVRTSYAAPPDGPRASIDGRLAMASVGGGGGLPYQYASGLEPPLYDMHLMYGGGDAADMQPGGIGFGERGYSTPGGAMRRGGGIESGGSEYGMHGMGGVAAPGADLRSASMSSAGSGLMVGPREAALMAAAAPGSGLGLGGMGGIGVIGRPGGGSPGTVGGLSPATAAAAAGSGPSPAGGRTASRSGAASVGSAALDSRSSSFSASAAGVSASGMVLAGPGVLRRGSGGGVPPSPSPPPLAQMSMGGGAAQPSPPASDASGPSSSSASVGTAAAGGLGSGGVAGRGAGVGAGVGMAPGGGSMSMAAKLQQVASKPAPPPSPGSRARVPTASGSSGGGAAMASGSSSGGAPASPGLGGGGAMGGGPARAPPELPGRFRCLPPSVQTRIYNLTRDNHVVLLKDFDEKVLSKMTLLVDKFGAAECCAMLDRIEEVLKGKAGRLANGPGYLDVSVSTRLDELKQRASGQVTAPEDYARSTLHSRIYAELRDLIARHGFLQWQHFDQGIINMLKKMPNATALERLSELAYHSFKNVDNPKSCIVSIFTTKPKYVNG